ncbi:hypothetical protein CsSME_00039859 [Camellia sinensis var. sinensis]
MLKKKSDIAHRPWNLLRLALLWARNGCAFKRKFMMDLSLFPKFLKSLGCSSEHGAIIHYKEQELSFENTPITHVRMHRPTSMRFQMPCIPCINPHIDFDCDFPDKDSNNDDDNDNDNDDDDDDNMSYYNERERKSFLMISDEDDNGSEVCEETISRGDEGIDVKAEQFIAKFYEQMKLQRQISNVEYYEMLNRGTN